MKWILSFCLGLGACGHTGPTTNDRRAPSGEPADHQPTEDDRANHTDEQTDDTNAPIVVDEKYLRISWDAVADDAIIAYRIYKKEGSETTELVTSVQVTATNFDRDHPTVSLAESALALAPGDVFCILVSALSATAESEKSVASCL